MSKTNLIPTSPTALVCPAWCAGEHLATIDAPDGVTYVEHRSQEVGRYRGYLSRIDSTDSTTGVVVNEGEVEVWTEADGPCYPLDEAREMAGSLLAAVGLAGQ